MFYQPAVNILDFFRIEQKWNAHLPLFLDYVVYTKKRIHNYPLESPSMLNHKIM